MNTIKNNRIVFTDRLYYDILYDNNGYTAMFSYEI